MRKADRVIAALDLGQPAAGYRVSPDIAGRCRTRVPYRHAAGRAGDRVAVDQTDRAGRTGQSSRAGTVNARCSIGVVRDGQAGRGYRKLRPGICDRVVVARVQRALPDRIAADVGCGGRGRGQTARQRVAVDQPGFAISQRRVGRAIRPRLGIGGDGQAGGVDRQRACVAGGLHRVDHVVFTDAGDAAAGHAIAADLAGRARSGCPRGAAADHAGRRIAVDQPGFCNRTAKSARRGAITTGCRIGGIRNRQAGWIDRQVGPGKGDRIIAARAQRTLGDRIDADVWCAGCRRGQVAGDRVAAEQAGLPISQRGNGAAVDAGLRVGGYGQARRVDLQRARSQSQVVTPLVRIKPRQRDRIGPGIGTAGACCAGGAENVGAIRPGRQGIAGHRLRLCVIGNCRRIAGDRQRCQKHAQQRHGAAAIDAPRAAGAARVIDSPARAGKSGQRLQRGGGHAGAANGIVLSGGLRVEERGVDRTGVRTDQTADRSRGLDRAPDRADGIAVGDRRRSTTG